MKSLEKCLLEAWVALHPGGFEQSKLPDYPNTPSITIPLSRVKEFNAQFAKIGEFAAYACGVPLDKFCDLDMLRFIREREERGAE